MLHWKLSGYLDGTCPNLPKIPCPIPTVTDAPTVPFRALPGAVTVGTGAWRSFNETDAEETQNMLLDALDEILRNDSDVNFDPIFANAGQPGFSILSKQMVTVSDGRVPSLAFFFFCGQF